VSTATKGRRAEHSLRATLEAAGYTVFRAAASKGVADLVAWNAAHMRLTSARAGPASTLQPSNARRCNSCQRRRGQ
jgi:hypothetical protein